MSRVTSKLQVTVPKAVADEMGIRPGDELEWIVAGEVIRVVPARERKPLDVRSRLRWFDAATERQRERETASARAPAKPRTRGWTREELYDRGRAR